MAVFQAWQQSVPDTAVCLSTVKPDSRAAARIVLLRGADDSGFHFFTSHTSPKARQLAKNPDAALTWYWPPDRQVRAEGTVVEMNDAGSDRLWSERPREAQLQVLAFEQSSVVESRSELETMLQLVRDEPRDVAELPRPAYWGGFTLVPDSIQFWAQGDDGIPDRHLYQRSATGWLAARLAP